MDLRTENRKSILQRLYRAACPKAAGKITVKELCEKAWINKSTFYAILYRPV